MDETNKDINIGYSFSDYDPNWKKEFTKIKEFLQIIFKEKALAIEHVGSTSVEGMKAKPLIDILVEVKKIASFLEEKELMKENGYEYKENYIAPNTMLFYKNNNEGEKIENIHVCEIGSPKSRQFIAMRDYLRSHPNIIKEYSDLKQNNYNLYPNNYIEYRSAKALFLQKLEREAYLWSETM